LEWTSKFKFGNTLTFLFEFLGLRFGIVFQFLFMCLWLLSKNDWK